MRAAGEPRVSALPSLPLLTLPRGTPGVFYPAPLFPLPCAQGLVTQFLGNWNGGYNRGNFLKLHTSFPLL